MKDLRFSRTLVCLVAKSHETLKWGLEPVFLRPNRSLTARRWCEMAVATQLLSLRSEKTVPEFMVLQGFRV